MNIEVRIERTGRTYSYASSEFRVHYPDGSEGYIWSSPWHEDDPQEEEIKAMRYAVSLYRDGKHTAK